MYKNNKFILGFSLAIIAVLSMGAYSYIHGDKAYTGIQKFMANVYSNVLYSATGNDVYLGTESNPVVIGSGLVDGVDVSSLSGSIAGKVDKVSPSVAGNLVEFSDTAGTQADTGIAATSVSGHIASTSNPHAVTKTQLGLSAVLNALQLYKDGSDLGAAIGDILYHNGSAWTVLTAPPAGNNYVVIRDSAGSVSNSIFNPASTATASTIASRDSLGNLYATKFYGDGSQLSNLPSSGHTIETDTTPLTQRTSLNFGSEFTVTDNAGTDATDVTLTPVEDLEFVAGDLSSGILTIPGLKTVACIVKNDGTTLGNPDTITYGAVDTTIDLSSFVTELGANTWKVKFAQGIGGTATGGATEFTGLTDVPSSYSGQAGKYVKVNSGENALEFSTVSSGGTTWNYITSSQTASVSQGYAAYAYSNEIDLTLPSSPSIGQTVSVRALNITQAFWLYRSGSDKIEGTASHLQIDTAGFNGDFTYINSEYGWVRSK